MRESKHMQARYLCASAAKSDGLRALKLIVYRFHGTNQNKSNPVAPRKTERKKRKRLVELSDDASRESRLCHLPGS